MARAGSCLYGQIIYFGEDLFFFRQIWFLKILLSRLLCKEQFEVCFEVKTKSYILDVLLGTLLTAWKIK